MVKRVWVPLLFHAFLIQASYAAVRPMFSYRGLELGLDAQDLLLVVASFNALPLAGAYFVGRLADRAGVFVVLLGGTGIALLANLFAVVASGQTGLLVASALVGFGQISSIIGQQVVVAARHGVATDQGFGWLAAAGAVGQVVGPPAVSFVAKLEVPGLTTAGAGLAGCSVITAAAVAASFTLRGASSPRPRGHGRRGPRARQILAIPGMWQVMLLGGVTICALDVIAALLPLWAEDRGVGVAAVGLLLGLRGAVTFVSRMGIRPLVGRFGRRAVLVMSAVSSAVALAGLPLVDLAGAVVVIVVIGLGLGIIPPLTASWVSTAVARAAGAALGLRLSLNRGVQVVVPLGVGTLLGGSATLAFVSSGALLLLMGAATTRVPSDPESRSAPVTTE